MAYTVNCYNMNSAPANKAILPDEPSEVLNVEWISMAYPSASIRLQTMQPARYTHFKIGADVVGIPLVLKVESATTIGKGLVDFSCTVDYIKTFFNCDMALSSYHYHCERSSDYELWSKFTQDNLYKVDGTSIVTVSESERDLFPYDFAMHIVASSIAYKKPDGIPSYEDMSGIVVEEVQPALLDNFIYEIFGQARAEAVQSNILSVYISPRVMQSGDIEFKYIDANGEPTPIEGTLVSLVPNDVESPVIPLTELFSITNFTDLEPFSHYRIYLPLIGEYVNYPSYLLSAGVDRVMYIYYMADASYDVWAMKDNRKVYKLATGKFPSTSLTFSKYGSIMNGALVNSLTALGTSGLSASVNGVAGMMGAAASFTSGAVNSVYSAYMAGPTVVGSTSSTAYTRDEVIKIEKTKQNGLVTLAEFAKDEGYFVGKDVEVSDLTEGTFYIIKAIKRMNGPKWLVDGINSDLEAGFIY